MKRPRRNAKKSKMRVGLVIEISKSDFSTGCGGGIIM